MIAAALLLAGCSSAAEAPTAPASTSASMSATPVPTATAEPEPSPTPTVDATADWQRIETEDGLFRWRIPADWSIVDESGESELDGRWMNRMDISNADGEVLAFFSSHYTGGDRGGVCDDWDGDGTGYVPAVVHLDEAVQTAEGPLTSFVGPVEEGRLVAFSSQQTADTAWFFAGHSLSDVREDSVPCLTYSDVPTPEGYPSTGFGTTGDPERWRMASLEEGIAYAATDEYDQLIEMFRSLELLEGPQ